MSDMILAIDTATEACSVALIVNGKCDMGFFEMLSRGHAERLIPMIAQLPQKGRAGSILVNCGPGSFTGVRVGLAAAKALAIAWNVPVNGYSTHALIAQMVRCDDRQMRDHGVSAPDSCRPDAIIVAMLGGHGEYFIQTFDHDAMPTTALANLKPDIAAQFLADRIDEQSIFAGNAAAALVALIGRGKARQLWPDARQAGRLDQALHYTAADPVYGRLPDAKISGSAAQSAPNG